MKLFDSLKKKSPEIFVVLGITGVIVATVKACQATRHVDEILTDHEEKLEEVKSDTSLMERDEKREITKTYLATGVRFAKLYGPSVVLGGVSIMSILHGHGILQRRYATLLASYTMLDRSYKVYRDRVINELGEAMDRHFRFGETEEEIEVEYEDENGKKKKKKEKVKVVDGDLESYSPYARIFDEFSSEWQDDPGVNKARILHVQQYLNDKLKIVRGGKVYLSEAYEALGFKVTKASLRAGWDRYSKTGDHFVDFGIDDIVKRAEAGDVAARMWVNGYEPNCLLDFNCYDITGDMDEI